MFSNDYSKRHAQLHIIRNARDLMSSFTLVHDDLKPKNYYTMFEWQIRREKKWKEGEGRRKKSLSCLLRERKVMKGKWVFFSSKSCPLRKDYTLNKTFHVLLQFSSFPFCYLNNRFSILLNSFLSFPSIYLSPECKSLALSK